MKHILTLALSLFIGATLQAQVHSAKDTSWKTVYRASATRVNDVVHTKLEVKFDYDKSYVHGKVWLTLQPHFYATDSLMLDAKGMDIHQVAISVDGTLKDLKYDYTDKNLLHIQLDKIYTKGEKYTVYIAYTAKPDEFEGRDKKTVAGAKGLYFINPKGKDKNKPTQIWTQGETEHTSVWCPTIDKPNQKTTQEIYLTVPDKYITLSNGLLINQTKNTDGTRTDYWKMDLPHAPYLMFIGVGEYAIIKDSYKNKEVSYYVEKPYESVARNIFGKTPEMITCFSTLTGVDYPWPKYNQMVSRDFIAGAQENTTATLHNESAQQNARQLVDGNHWEDVISHELFHHWFGDLVTCESWSNITVNESFATYGEVLWREYKYGKESADEHRYEDLQTYLASKSEDKDLVRFYYEDKDDVFDRVSYPKGGCILNMLRTVVGDSAFFKSLHLYLTSNKFKSAEAHQLRLAFEEITGQDLNWFFNQWYYGSGHPILDIAYDYDNSIKMVNVHIKQTQQTGKTFKLPFAIDVHDANTVKRYNVMMDKAEQTFSFPASPQYNWVSVDADKYLVCEKTDHQKTANYIYQYTHAKNYIDRKEAMDYFGEHISKLEVRNILPKAIQDKYYKLRIQALNIFEDAKNITAQEEKLIYQIAQKDPYRLVQASAIDVLDILNKNQYKKFLIAATQDSSYSVAGAALQALSTIDKIAAKTIADKLKNDTKGRLNEAIDIIDIINKTDSDFDIIAKDYESKKPQEKFTKTKQFIYYLSVVKNTEKLKKGIDMLIQFRDMIAPYYPPIKEFIKTKLNLLIKLKTKNGGNIKEQMDYIKSKI